MFNNAAVEVQNRVSIALPTLPDAVKRLGLTVRKRNPSIMVAPRILFTKWYP